MSQKLDDLLLRWELGRRGGNPVSVDELCRDCPELLSVLRSQIAALEKMDAMLDFSPTDQAPMSPNQRRTRYDDLRPGWEPISGYRLEKKLGAGGFGEVWKAIGPGGFGVALKFVPLSSQLGASEIRSLDVLKKVHHPNLLSILGAWQAHGFLMVAMEQADKTLLDRLTEVTTNGQIGIPKAELIQYMQEIAKGLDYLNQPNANLGDSAKEAIQHRDIKPQNLFLMGGGVKIGDFGLMRILKKTVTDHTGSLTLSYAPPEFFQGHTARTSDQYSLAVTYCQLRGGRLPFVGNPGQVMEGHLKGTPDLTMLPEGERAAVARALDKDPHARWPTCSEFVNALTIDGSASMTSTSSARRPKVARLLLPGVLVAVLVIAVISLAWRFGPWQNKGPQVSPDKDRVSLPDEGDEWPDVEIEDPRPPSVDPPLVMADESKRLSGVWIRQSITSNGKTSQTPTSTQVLLSGDRMTYTYIAKQEAVWRFVIDPTKSPKAFDRMSGTKVVLGIYKLEGDRLTYAFSPTGDRNRPTDFTSPKGSKIIVQVYKRK